MKFYVHSNVLGTSKHLFYDDERLSWSEKIDDESWVFDIEGQEHTWNLLILARLCLTKINTVPSQGHERAMTLLLSSSNATINVPWNRALPPHSFKQFTLQIIKGCKELLSDDQIVSYYENVWKVGTDFLSSFHRAHINEKRLDDFLLDVSGNMHVLMSFRPDKSGFANNVCYNRFGTRTGRLTTMSGPDMLTLKKEYRCVVDSQWGDDGKVVMIDFCQLEPSIMLYEAGNKRSSSDLYDSINIDLFSGQYERSDIKLALIASLYGQGEFMLMKNLGMKKDEVKEFTNRISQLFDKRNLTSRIKGVYSSTGHIINHHGRHLMLEELTDHMFVNTYVQSTGVDVSLLGFSDLVNRLDSNLCRPLFMIHDAVMLDCHSSIIDDVLNTTSVNVFGFNQPFAVKPEILNCT